MCIDISQCVRLETLLLHLDVGNEGLRGTVYGTWDLHWAKCFFSKIRPFNILRKVTLWLIFEFTSN